MTEESKVVTIRGAALPSPGQPNEATVEALEKLLEMARSGEIAGVAVATYNTDGSGGFRLAGILRHPVVLGRLVEMQTIIATDMSND